MWPLCHCSARKQDFIYIISERLEFEGIFPWGKKSFQAEYACGPEALKRPIRALTGCLGSCNSLTLEI